MKISIAAIGKLKNGPESELFARFLKRSVTAGKGIGISTIDIREFREANDQDANNRKQKEASNLLSHGSSNAIYIAMDENGRDFTSVEFGQLIGKSLDNGDQHLVFAIGGAEGHGAELLEKATHTVRMGKMTWPHQIARILLIEQIYRAITLITGHPYHRE